MDAPIDDISYFEPVEFMGGAERFGSIQLKYFRIHWSDSNRIRYF